MAVTFWRYLRERVWAKSRTFNPNFPSEEPRSILRRIKAWRRKRRHSRHFCPQCGAFSRFPNRSLRCTLRGAFAVIGEREGLQMPVTADFSRWTFRRRLRKLLFSTTQKSAFHAATIFDSSAHILRRCSQGTSFGMYHFSPLSTFKSPASGWRRCGRSASLPGTSRMIKNWNSSKDFQ